MYFKMTNRSRCCNLGFESAPSSLSLRILEVGFLPDDLGFSIAFVIGARLHLNGVLPDGIDGLAGRDLDVPLGVAVAEVEVAQVALLEEAGDLAVVVADGAVPLWLDAGLDAELLRRRGRSRASGGRGRGGLRAKRGVHVHFAGRGKGSGRGSRG